jgi:hypothetical protein
VPYSWHKWGWDGTLISWKSMQSNITAGLDLGWNPMKLRSSAWSSQN